MVASPHQPHISPALEMVLDAVTGWVNRFRHTVQDRTNLANLGPDQVMAIAKDLGITSAQLQELARKGPNAADMLKKLLTALDVDPALLDKIDQRDARDLKWICVSCSKKTRCRHELAAGTAAKNYREFCPNALAIDALFLTNGNSRVSAPPKTS